MQAAAPKKRVHRLQSAPPSLKEHHVLVAAIDFGTTYSGYAFALTAEPDNIRMNKNWASGRFDSYKTPTTILFCPDGKILFGFEAMER